MTRIDMLLEKLEAEHLDGLFLITNQNVRYLSGFTGSDSFLLISNKANYLITDGRYVEQAEAQCPDFHIVNWRQPSRSLTEAVSMVAGKLNIKRLGFEKDYMTYDMHDMLVKDISDAEIIPRF